MGRGGEWQQGVVPRYVVPHCGVIALARHDWPKGRERDILHDHVVLRRTTENGGYTEQQRFPSPSPSPSVSMQFRGGGGLVLHSVAWYLLVPHSLARYLLVLHSLARYGPDNFVEIIVAKPKVVKAAPPSKPPPPAVVKVVFVLSSCLLGADS